MRLELEKPTLNQMLDQVSERFAEREAIVTTESRTTYRELHDSVSEFARGLLSLGIGKGDHVGVLMSTRLEWFIATYAIERVGATMVGLNTWYKQDELEYALKKADVSALISRDSFLENDYLELLTDIAPELSGTAPDTTSVDNLPYLDQVIIHGEAPDWAHAWDDVCTRGNRISAKRLEAAAESVDPEDPAYILFSSGTTGRPKPIMLTHDGLVTNGQSIGARLSITKEDRFWLPLPLFFSFAACNESITALSHGATLVLQERFIPEQAVDYIPSEECTVVYGMGNMYRQMEELSADLSDVFETVRLGLIIAPEELRRRFEQEHNIGSVLNGYGLTEVCAICAITSPTASDRHRHETMGQPLANVDIRIKDPETGGEVQPGEQGEICLRTRTMFQKYYNMPEKTRDAFDTEGYFHTGDIGHLTPDGRVVFEGRMDDMIKTKGINVSPKEVENVLEKHPKISEGVVIGLSDDEMGEAVGAIIKPTERASLSPEDIKSFCKEQIASYKVPDVIYIRDQDFPRTDTGKVRKVELEETYQDRYNS